MKYYVFYDMQLYGVYDWRIPGLVNLATEIYNGAYVHCNKAFPLATGGTSHWMRMDGTPLAPEDVPREVRTLALLTIG